MRTRNPNAEIVLDIKIAITDWWWEHCYPPTIRDIAHTLGISTSHVLHHVNWLRDEGWLTYEDGKSRTIVPEVVRSFLQ